MTIPKRSGSRLHLLGLLVTAGLAAPTARADTAGPTTLNGTYESTIVDWPKGKTGTVSLLQDQTSLASGPIDATGHFSIQLPDPSTVNLDPANVSELFIPKSVLRGPEDACAGQGTATPTDAHYVIYDLSVSIEGDPPTVLKLASDPHWPTPVGQQFSDLNFFDVPTTLHGSVTCTGSLPPATVVYNGTFPAGWSLPVETVTAVSADGTYTDVVTPDPLPTNVRWHLYDLRAGIGVQLNLITPGAPGVKITGVTPGQPAERAGLRADDRLVEIDGKDVTGLTVNQVVSLIRGPTNTPVTLGVKRGSETAIRQITVVRAEIQVR